MSYWGWSKGFSTATELAEDIFDVIGYEATGINVTNFLLHPHPSSVFVPASALKQFYDEVLPHWNHQLVLVSGDGDKSPVEILGEDTALALAGRVHRWFGQNIDIVHPNVVPLPIGLDLHTMFCTDLWGGPMSVYKQEQELFRVRAAAPAPADRPNSVFVQFGSRPWPERLDLQKAITGDASLQEAYQVDKSTELTRSQVWEVMREHFFVASPPGGGTDCHRTWEALILGCAVLVPDTPNFRTLFNNLPVIFVSDWANPPNPAALARYRERMLDSWNSFQFEKLTMGYWQQRIRTAATEASRLPDGQ